MTMDSITRREILRLLATGAAWPFADRLLPAEIAGLFRDVHAAAQNDGERGRTLEPQVMALVETACERIIPRNDTPGAGAAGVPGFIDRMLSDWYDADERERFVHGLAALDARSRDVYERPFNECAPAEQDALLMFFDDEVQRLEADRRASHWFGLLKFLTVWGYCTSEIGMREGLRIYPAPMRYDADAPYDPRRGSRG